MPTVLEHYVNQTASRSDILTSSLPGIDLNDVLKTLKDKQRYNISNQVVEYIYTLAELTRKKIQSIDKG